MAGNPAGSRNVEVYEKVEQVGEGTYGCATPAEKRKHEAGALWPSPACVLRPLDLEANHWRWMEPLVTQRHTLQDDGRSGKMVIPRTSAPKKQR